MDSSFVATTRMVFGVARLQSESSGCTLPLCNHSIRQRSFSFRQARLAGNRTWEQGASQDGGPHDLFEVFGHGEVNFRIGAERRLS
jgi:hypothetical protein